MKLSDIAALTTLNLTFGTETPVEESFYLVLGKLECPNGFVGPHFAVCGHMLGDWYIAPDGPKFDKGFLMWDGHESNVHAPFTPIKWAKLPDAEE